MKLPDGLTPIPHHPSYLVRADGRVYSLRTDRWLTETGGEWRTPDRRRVQIDGRHFRVRDLVDLTLGKSFVFELRAWREREAWMDTHPRTDDAPEPIDQF